MANMYKTSGDTDAGSVNYHIQPTALVRGLRRLKSDLVLAKLVTNYSADAAGQGSRFASVVRVPKTGTTSVTDKTPGTAVTYAAAQSAKADISINKHKTVDRLIEDYGLLFAQPTLLGDYVADAADAIAEQIDTDIAALYASAGAIVGSAGANLSDAVVREVRKTARGTSYKFNLSNPIYFVVGEEAEADLLGIDRFTLANQSGSMEALENAFLGRKYGMDFYTSNLIASVAGTAGAEHNLVFQSDAIGLAFVDMDLMNVPSAFAGGVDMQTMVMPDDNGVPAYSMRSIIGYDQKERGTTLSVDTVYGVGVVRDEHLFDVLS